MSAIEKWINGPSSSEFLRNIGLKNEDKLLDFGCGKGNYSISAAEFLSEKGKVYAVDKNKRALRKLNKRAKKRGLKNIETVNNKGKTSIPFEKSYFDFSLLYDVIHLFENRKKIYKELNRVLKKNGILSIYPKHYKSDSMIRGIFGRNLNKDLEEIIDEVKEENFSLDAKFQRNLIHNRSIEEGNILNFRKR